MLEWGECLCLRGEVGRGQRSEREKGKVGEAFRHVFMDVEEGGLRG